MIAKQSLTFVLILLSVSSLHGSDDTAAPQTGDIACSNTFDQITDSLLKRMTPNLKSKTLPDMSVSSALLSNITLFGLENITRSCDVKLIIVPDSRDLNVRLCMSIKALEMDTTVKANIFITTITEAVTINVDDIDVEVVMSIPIKTGGQPIAKVVDVKQIRDIKVNSFTGIARLLNPILKTMKKVIRGRMGDSIKSAINERIKNFVI